jgi:transcriptional regulator with XRE-family HTH domain
MTTGQTCDNWSSAVPGPDERARLAGTLGEVLRGLRAERGLSTRRLAVRAAVARSTILRLESGERRPRPSLLQAVAYGLDHKDPGPLAALLMTAAGASVRPDTAAALRRRRRIVRRRRRVAGRQRYALAMTMNAARAQSTEAIMRSCAVLDRPGALDDEASLIEVQKLHDAAQYLDCEADAIGMALARWNHPLEKVQMYG